MAACTPASLWLLTAWRGQMPDRQFTQIFCEADRVNGALRRGQGSWVVGSRIDERVWGVWTLQQKHRYAQLVLPGHAFEQINGERDLNRPFRVHDEFTDEELVSLVTFLRARPSWLNGVELDRVTQAQDS